MDNNRKKREKKPISFKKHIKHLFKSILAALIILVLVGLATLVLCYIIGLFVGHIANLEKQKEFFNVLSRLGNYVLEWFGTILVTLGLNFIVQILFSNAKIIKSKFINVLAIFLILLGSTLGLALAGTIGKTATANTPPIDVPGIQLDDIQSVDSQLEDKLLIVDISDIWFIIKIDNIDFDTICQSIVEYLNSTNYKNKQDPSDDYKELADKASTSESKIKNDYPVNKYRGETNMDEEAISIHTEYNKKMQDVLSLREEADGYDTTYENNKEIANYHFTLGDVNMRIGNYETAYRNYLEAVKYYVIALQLSLSCPYGMEKALYILGQLANTYGSWRLQDDNLLNFTLQGSVSLDQIKKTEAMYLTMVQYVNQLNFNW